MKYSLFFLFFLFLGVLATQTISTEQQTRLDSLVQMDVRLGSPGVAVGIVHNGKIIYENYAGLADLETEVLIDGSTRFNIASNAKQFTAICVLQLAEQGLLSLSDDIRKYLPELYPDVRDPITITHLIDHTSGIREVGRLWSLQGITWWKQTLTNTDAFQLLQQQKSLNFRPGSRHLYCNSNYLLLTEIVSRVSKLSFLEFSNQLFADLGMNETAFLADHTLPVPNLAKPYFNFDTWKGYDWLSDLHGDGALFSSLSDQLKWEMILQNGESKGLSNQLIAKSQKPIQGSSIATYGFGLELEDVRGLPCRLHHGSTGAWKASTIRLPTQDLSVVVLTNSGATWPPSLVLQCAEVILGADKFPATTFPLQPEEIGAAIPREELIGTYCTDFGQYLRIKEHKDTLFLERFGRKDIILEKVSGSLYQEVTDPAFKQSFTRDQAGQLKITFYYPTHAPYSFNKVNIDPAAFNFKAAEGAYVNHETKAEIRILHLADGNYQVNIRKKNREGKLYEPNQLVLRNYRLELVFDEGGMASHFMYFDDRSKNIRFDRIE